MRPILALVSLLLGLFAAGCEPAATPPAVEPPVVLAASSLQESMNAAADAWAAKGQSRPVVSFAASSALARQIIGSAPADLFVSADREWMSAVEGRGLVRSDTRQDFLGNKLVLIAPADSNVVIELTPGVDLAAALGDGRLAMADPDAVPAGRYGRAALTNLLAWDGVADLITRAENVRAALALVERGEAPLGIVYATDARASDAVRVIATFGPQTHPPIRYPVAVLMSSTSPDASLFRDFLVSEEGREIFLRFGFTE